MAFSGPTAQDLQDGANRLGLPPLTDIDGKPAKFDVLRPQRLAAPVTVYVEQFSAHPLERDATPLGAEPVVRARPGGGRLGR